MWAENAGLSRTSRLRGRGRFISIDSRIFVGDGAITKTRSPKKTASGMECVTNRSVLLVLY